MASITIRNLDEEVKRRLRRQAAEHGHSLEAEARKLLRQGTGLPSAPPVQTAGNLYDDIRALVEPLGGIDLEIPPRTRLRGLPDFGKTRVRRKARDK